MKKKIVERIITVSIAKQQLEAVAGGKSVFNFRCVTGDAAHPTPKGKFKIIRKERIYRSRTYNSQMNYALQITRGGIFIHESYNYIENPSEQSFFARAVSDTAVASVSRMRTWFPSFNELNMKMGNINLVGSHGCIRLAHTDAVKLFDWARKGDLVNIE